VSQSSLGERTLWTLGSYEGLLQSCIATIKNRGHRALAEELSQVAALRFLELFPHRAEVSAVMAVPASRQGQRFRGFSLPQMMEDALRAQSGWPTLPSDIRRCYRSAAKSSKGMGGAERLARMHGDRLEAHPEAKGKGLLLVDDVVTTGATLNRCLTQARQQGFEPIYCFALAEHRPISSAEN
jgi:predicted amidophosphoribosyltransferase